LEQIDSDNFQILAMINELKRNQEEITKRVSNGQSRLNEMNAKKDNLLKELAEMEERTKLMEDRKEIYYPKVMKD
jgi:predicted nuclease with TOPRIM domain